MAELVKCLLDLQSDICQALRLPQGRKADPEVLDGYEIVWDAC